MRHPTIGGEEEFLIVDKESHMPVCVDFEHLLSSIAIDKQSNFTPELHKCAVESKSGICLNDEQLIDELNHLRDLLAGALAASDLRAMAVGVHPYANIFENEFYTKKPYTDVAEEYRAIAQINCVSGFHLHVGVDEKEIPYVFNMLRNYIPLFNAIAAGSQYCNGKNTGLKSFRYRLFKTYPRSNMPNPIYTLENYLDELHFLLSTGSITKLSSVWTDLRVHPQYKTIEIRSPDMQPNWAVTKGLVSLVYGLSSYFLTQRPNEEILPTFVLEENAWRACRWGLETNFIANTKGELITGSKWSEDTLNKISPYISSYSKENIARALACKSIDEKELSNCKTYLIKE